MPRNPKVCCFGITVFDLSYVIPYTINFDSGVEPNEIPHIHRLTLNTIIEKYAKKESKYSPALLNIAKRSVVCVGKHFYLS